MGRQASTLRFVGVALTVFAIIGSACGPAPASPAGQASPAGAPKRGGELRVQLIRDSSTGYDPAQATESTVFTINGLIFDTLVEVRPDGSLAPSLAEEWKISADELSYTFKIRKGVKFHNGREMTADDVKYTIERIQDPATKSPRRTLYAVVQSIQAPDATTLVVTLKEPFSPFIYAVADTTAAIVPKEVVAAEKDLNNKPVGTGPFSFTSWTRDQQLKVQANKEYWRQGLPRLDAVTFSFNEDANARAAAIRAQNVDFLWNSPPELYEVLQADPTVQIYGGEGTLSWQYLLLNMTKTPFQDVKVRQAIFWALDREEVRKISRPTTTSPLNAGFLPPGHWAGVKDIVYKQDYEKARKLLADAGVASGFKMEIVTLVGSNFHIRSAQAIQQQLKPLGIEVEVKIVDSGQLTTVRNSGSFHSMVLGFSGTIDPDERFAQTFMTGGGTNYVKFSDKTVDELATKARKTSNRDERAKLYREAQLRIAEVGPFAFTYNYHFYDTLAKSVKGYVFNPQLVDYRSIREVWLDK